MSAVVPTPGAKMQFLITRRPGTSRDELVANWFANHMPEVVARELRRADNDQPHARRYIATLFDSSAGGGEAAWDGVAQLWFDEPFARSDTPFGTEPRDTFQQKAAPYVGWPTTEHVVVDGELPLTPNTLNDPFPCTRSGFFKVTALLTTKPGVDHDEFFGHWLEVHAPNVADVMAQAGGYRYVVSHSMEPGVDPHAGMAELYFADREGWDRYRELAVSDGFGDFVAGVETFTSNTEMIGIP